MDKHIQAAAKALHKVNALPLDMALAAVRAWLDSLGMDSTLLDFFADHIPSGTVRLWAVAVRGIEES